MLTRLGSFLVICFLLLTAVYAQDTDPALFSGQRAFQHVANHVNVGPRPVGSPEIILAGNIILNYLESVGWQTDEQWHVLNFGRVDALDDASKETLEHWNRLDFDVMLENYLSDLGAVVSVNGVVNFDLLVVPVRNLVASYGVGSKTIIIGAHYDSRILSDKDSDPERRTTPMPGANDGGSGVGVLLELARVISENYTVNPDYEIRLVFFDAEDNGRIAPFNRISWAASYSSGYLIGSALYAADLNLDEEDIQYMVLVDLVGDMEQRFPIEGYSNQSAPDIVKAIWDTAAGLGYQDYFVPESGSTIIDDHLPFVQRGIPAVDIIDLDYPYWDTSQDTLDKVSSESLERVGRVLQAHLEQSGIIKKKE